MNEKQFIQETIRSLKEQKACLEKQNKKYRNSAIDDLVDSLDYQISNLQRELEDM